MEEKKKTNGWSIAGFASSFFTTIIAFILCIIALKKAKKYEWDGKALSIIGLVLSSVKLVFLILLTAVCIIAYNFYKEYNIKDCLTASNCTENNNGTYTCDKDGKSIKCLYSTGEITKNITNDITNDMIDSAIRDIDLNINDNDSIDKYVNSEYEEYNKAVEYLYTNSSNIKFNYIYNENGKTSSRELSLLEVLTVIGVLKTQMPDGELSSKTAFETVNSIETKYIDNGDNINFKIIQKEDTYYVVIDNQTKQEYHEYTFSNTLTNIFGLLN